MATQAGGPTEETHHKMQKKIAQLTKVIFHLHSQNEGNSHFHTALNNAHEKEIEVILKEANSIITKQKEQIKKIQEANDFKTKMKEIENNHLEEKQIALKEFNSYKEAIKAKEQSLEKDHNKKV